VKAEAEVERTRLVMTNHARRIGSLAPPSNGFADKEPHSRALGFESAPFDRAEYPFSPNSNCDRIKAMDSAVELTFPVQAGQRRSQPSRRHQGDRSALGDRR
jgi:hypothetical protein